MWRPEPLVAALGLPPEALADITAVVAPVATADASTIEDAFLAALTSG